MIDTLKVIFADDSMEDDSVDESMQDPTETLLAPVQLEDENDKSYRFQLNNQYYEAEVGFAAPPYWDAEYLQTFHNTREYPDYFFEAKGAHCFEAMQPADSAFADEVAFGPESVTYW